MAVINEDGWDLYPVVVQDAESGTVLMVAFANPPALALTRETGLAHFYSRSRHQLWQKGETSGHVLPVEAVWTDCDADSFIYRARPLHPVCHRNTPGCFDEATAHTIPNPLAYLKTRVQERVHASPETSYTAKLLTAPIDRLLKKIGEEATEVVIAALSQGPQELTWESADLLYHLSVLWQRAGLSLQTLETELERRHRPA